jgi:hypothetical protein
MGEYWKTCRRGWGLGSSLAILNSCESSHAQERTGGLAGRWASSGVTEHPYSNAGSRLAECAAKNKEIIGGVER